MEQPDNAPVAQSQQHTIWKDLLGSLVDFDHGIPGTLRALVIKPQIVLQSYLKGERLYINPFRLLLLFTGLYYLLHNLLIDETVYVKNMFHSLQSADITAQLGGRVMKQTQDIMMRLNSQYGTLNMVMFTLFITVSVWLFFRRSVGSFAASLAGSSYVLTLFMALSLVFVLPVEVLIYDNVALLGNYLQLYNWFFIAFILVGVARMFSLNRIGHYLKLALSVLVAYLLYSVLLFVTIGLVIGLQSKG